MVALVGAEPAESPEPRGAWCRRLGRRGEAFRGRVRELGKQHSPKLTTTRIAFIVSLRLHRRKTRPRPGIAEAQNVGP